MKTAESLLTPDWQLPSGVRAAVTLRAAGFSTGAYASNNLAHHVGDDPLAVARNRRQLLQNMPGATAIQWLNQIHSPDVAEACGGRVLMTADAQFSRTPGLACAVLTADCLPVLFCAADGSQVAAAHAGWRGLAAGVLLNTLRTFRSPQHVSVWLGPAIGPDAFEVGPEVKAAFPWASPACFRAGTGDRWLADIYALAREQLLTAGVARVTGGGFCTVSEKERFYSYRRRAVTGRLASLIWIENGSRR
ncbi:peptidoglycan editing factor PgeF [Thalassolituus sp. LLYu03]|uniref:peptidoglycan editing factor PgeF n=1 Tax=Thalassolituus sp. LLYu03 TaxID=3421656 RepID=UPI003D2A846D